jgi:hypothetical protein
MENYVARNRPPAHIRDKLDLSYKIENQSAILFNIREAFKQPGTYIELPFAKATFVKSSNHWKVYWMRANGWSSYDPKPIVKTLKDFIKLVEEDKHHCFRG